MLNFQFIFLRRRDVSLIVSLFSGYNALRMTGDEEIILNQKLEIVYRSMSLTLD